MRAFPSRVVFVVFIFAIGVSAQTDELFDKTELRVAVGFVLSLGADDLFPKV